MKYLFGILLIGLLFSCGKEKSNISNEEVRSKVKELIAANKERINEMRSETQRPSQIQVESTQEVEQESPSISNKQWVFFSANMRGKTIISSPYENERVYEYLTKCTKVYEISRSEYLELEEIMVDELPTANWTASEITGHRYNSYEEAYAAKKKMSEGKLYTDLIDLKWDYR